MRQPLFAWAALVLCGCSHELIAANECGNRIVEEAAGEDCDGGASCRGPSEAAPCRFRCDAGLLSSRQDPGCPAGYGCGIDNVCRRASGVFTAADTAAGAQTLGLANADLDADGRHDLVQTTADATTLLFYADGLELQASTDVARTPSLPKLGDLTGDGRTDLLYRVALGGDFGSGVAVYRAQPDRSMASTTYAGLPIPSEAVHARLLPVLEPMTDDEIIALVDDQVLGVSDEGQVATIGTSPLNATMLVSSAAANLNEDPVTSPCHELVLAGRGASEIHVLEPCLRAQNGAVVWRVNDSAAFTTIDLPASSRVFAYDGDDELVNTRDAIFIADWNADARLDLLIVTATTDDPSTPMLSVAYGVGDGSFHSDPQVPATAGDNRARNLSIGFLGDCTEPLGAPLAVADFNNDGTPDIISENVILTSTDTATRAVAACGVGWRRVLADDFDADGALDIVATRQQEQGLDFLLGAGDGEFASITIPTQRLVFHMTSGDFDGDGHRDLMWVERGGAVDGVSLDDVLVAFGTPAGSLEAAMLLGNISSVEHVAAGRFLGRDSTSDLVIVTRLTERLRSTAIVGGSAARQLVTPFFFGVESGVATPIVTDVLWLEHGRFDPSTNALGAAIITVDEAAAGGSYRMWRMRAEGEAELEATRSAESSTAQTDLACPRCIAAVLDLNGDGIDEVVTFAGSDMVIFTVAMSGDDAGELVAGEQLTASVTVATPQLFGHNAAPQVRDVDGDGFDDVAVLADNGDVVIFWGEGSGSLDPAQATVIERPRTGANFGSFALLNADADDALEVLIVSELGVSMLQTEGRSVTPIAMATALPITAAPGTDAVVMTAGDFDGDGVDDFALGDFAGRTVFRGGRARP